MSWKACGIATRGDLTDFPDSDADFVEVRGRARVLVLSPESEPPPAFRLPLAIVEVPGVEGVKVGRCIGSNPVAEGGSMVISTSGGLLALHSMLTNASSWSDIWASS